MTTKTWRLLLCGLVLSACDTPQYVNPDTFALSVTDDATGAERVHRCHYVPVLLGSRIEFRYRVDSGVNVTLTVTREVVNVAFEQDGTTESSGIDTRELSEPGASTAIDWAPTGYTAELVAGCTPDDEYEP